MTTFAILRYFLASSMSLFFLAFRAACLYSFILSFKKFSCCSAREVGLLFSAVKNIKRHVFPLKTIKTWGLFSRIPILSEALARISYTSNTIFLLNRAQVPFTWVIHENKWSFVLQCLDVCLSGVSFCGCCCCVAAFGCEGLFCGCVAPAAIFAGEAVLWFCAGDLWSMFGCSWLADEDDDDGEAWGGPTGIGAYPEIVFLLLCKFWCFES